MRFGVEVAALARDAGIGEARITLTDGGKRVTDEILVATGLGLETVEMVPGDWLNVDDTFRVTAVPGGLLYAVGDVNRRALLTHQGKYQARIAGAVIGARAKGEAVDESW